MPISVSTVTTHKRWLGWDRDAQNLQNLGCPRIVGACYLLAAMGDLANVAITPPHTHPIH